MIGTASKVLLWKHPSIKVFERRVDRYWRDQDIIYYFEAALSSGHSDWAGNDISRYASDIDQDMLRPLKSYANLSK